ncbi:MAG: hypothetical protein HYY52_04275 [Candidatus Melainabacteria bacterium]|nr:hypothetical protein [Candidatus Melainabacteria bacterium]
MPKAFYIFFFALIFFIAFSGCALACLSFTDDYNFPNPVLNANFNILPDVSPFTECWTGVFRIRSKQNGWRLIASREGPMPLQASGAPADNVKASDVTLDFSIKSFGQAPPNGAVLVSPFSSITNLSSIQSGTFIVSGIAKSSNSCSSNNPSFYRLTKNLCLFHDFVFNPGEYNGQVSYILVAP